MIALKLVINKPIAFFNTAWHYFVKDQETTDDSEIRELKDFTTDSINI
jgi:hypothetical protein